MRAPSALDDSGTLRRDLLACAVAYGGRDLGGALTAAGAGESAHHIPTAGAVAQQPLSAARRYALASGALAAAYREATEVPIAVETCKRQDIVFSEARQQVDDNSENGAHSRKVEEGNEEATEPMNVTVEAATTAVRCGGKNVETFGHSTEEEEGEPL